MEKSGQKKFIIRGKESSSHFAILCIMDLGMQGGEQGTLTFLWTDQFGFVRPCDNTWFELNHLKDFTELKAVAEKVCEENGVKLTRV